MICYKAAVFTHRLYSVNKKVEWLHIESKSVALRLRPRHVFMSSGTTGPEEGKCPDLNRP